MVAKTSDRPRRNSRNDTMLKARIAALETQLAERETTSPIATPLPQIEGTQRWYVCPRCNGEGIHEEIPNPAQPWRKRRSQCSQCQGNRMVKVAENSRQALRLTLVYQCEKCLNWYAKGAGRRQDETNWPPFQEGSSHSHWYDLSFYPPPDTQRLALSGMPEGYEGPAQVEGNAFEQDLAKAGANVSGGIATA